MSHLEQVSKPLAVLLSQIIPLHNIWGLVVFCCVYLFIFFCNFLQMWSVKWFAFGKLTFEILWLLFACLCLIFLPQLWKETISPVETLAPYSGHDNSDWQFKSVKFKHSLHYWLNILFLLAHQTFEMLHHVGFTWKFNKTMNINKFVFMFVLKIWTPRRRKFWANLFYLFFFGCMCQAMCHCSICELGLWMV